MNAIPSARIIALTFLFSITSSVLIAQTAQVQFLHNAPDPALSTIDVYLDGVLVADNFGFREATPFVDVPSDIEVNIVLAPGSSAGPDDAVVNFSRSFSDGRAHFVMVAGVSDPTIFAPNPDGKGTSIQLVVNQAARTASSVSNVAQFFFAHGAPDAPQARIWLLGRGALGGAPATGFGDISGHGHVVPSTQTVEIRTADGKLASIDVDWSGLSGQAGALVASGFVEPAENSSGPGLTLLQVMADGTVTDLARPAPDASFQFIHSSPDPALETINVSLERLPDDEEGSSKQEREQDDDVSVDDLPYGRGRTSSARAGRYSASISGGASKTGNSDPLASFEITLEEGQSYSLILTGLATPESFVPNPDASNTGLQLIVNDEIRSVAPDPTTVEVLFVHGIPDAPIIDVLAVVNEDTLEVVDDLPFGGAVPYQTLSANTAEVLLTLGQDRSAIVGTFATDFATFAGSALIAVASGFVDPDQNEGGEPLDLFGILPDDSEWTSERNALLQFIHAVPELKSRRLFVFARKLEPTAEKSEGPTDDDPSVDDLPYRRGRSQSLVAGFYSFALAADTSSSASKTAALDTLATFDVDLTTPDSYSLVFAGVTDPSSFIENPEGSDINLQLLISNENQTFAKDENSVAVTFVHTITDAPSIEILRDSGEGPQLLVPGVSFGEFVEPLQLPAELVTFSIVPATLHDTLRYSVDLTGLGGSAFTVPLTGFLDPAGNGSDEGIGIALIGGSDESPVTTDAQPGRVDLPSRFRLLGNYPNPFNPSTRVLFDAPMSGEVRIWVYDLAGRIVLSTNPTIVASGAGQSLVVHAENLPSGVYLYRIQLDAGARSHVAAGRMVLVR